MGRKILLLRKPWLLVLTSLQLSAVDNVLSFTGLRTASVRRSPIKMTAADAAAWMNTHKWKFTPIFPEGYPTGDAQQDDGAATEVPMIITGPDENQVSLIQTSHPSVLLASGVGTGKTSVLAARAAFLVLNGHCAPSQLLVLGFAAAQARDLCDRANALLGGAPRTDAAFSERIDAGTFHAFCAQVLRKHGRLVLGRADFTIAEAPETLHLVRGVLREHGRDASNKVASLVLKQVTEWKERGVGPERAREEAERELREDSRRGGGEPGFRFGGGGGAQPPRRLSAEVYPLFQERLVRAGLLGFPDLLLYALRLFREHPHVLAEYRRRFRHILVDEFQDCTPSQTQLLWLLRHGLGPQRGGVQAPGEPEVHLFAAGDAHQSLYSWRGAAPGHRNLRAFRRHFRDGRVLQLKQSYRLPGDLLAAAGGLLAHNRDVPGIGGSIAGGPGQQTLGLWSRPGVGAGDPVVVQGLWDGTEEAKWVARQIARCRREAERAGGPPVDLSQVAVLVRTRLLLGALEEQLLMAGLPYRLEGGRAFYARKELERALTLLRLLCRPANDAAFELCATRDPAHRVGDLALAELKRFARQQGGQKSLYQAAFELLRATRPRGEEEEEEGEEGGAGGGGPPALGPPARAALEDFLMSIDQWRCLVLDHWERGDKARRLLRRVCRDAGYLPFDYDPETHGAQRPFASHEQLICFAAEFPTLADFLEHLSVGPAEEDAGWRRATGGGGEEGNNSNRGASAAGGAAAAAATGAVQLMTMHQAKGREFDLVFLPGWEDGLFPFLPREGTEETAGRPHPAGSGWVAMRPHRRGPQEERSAADEARRRRRRDAAAAAAEEEERRLAFVALTRARRRAVVTYAGRRLVYGRLLHQHPSRFIEELPRRHVRLSPNETHPDFPGQKQRHTGGLRGQTRPDPLLTPFALVYGPELLRQMQEGLAAVAPAGAAAPAAAGGVAAAAARAGLSLATFSGPTLRVPAAEVDGRGGGDSNSGGSGAAGGDRGGLRTLAGRGGAAPPPALRGNGAEQHHPACSIGLPDPESDGRGRVAARWKEAPRTEEDRAVLSKEGAAAGQQTHTAKSDVSITDDRNTQWKEAPRTEDGPALSNKGAAAGQPTHTAKNDVLIIDDRNAQWEKTPCTEDTTVPSKKGAAAGQHTAKSDVLLLDNNRTTQKHKEACGTENRTVRIKNGSAAGQHIHTAKSGALLIIEDSTSAAPNSALAAESPSPLIDSKTTVTSPDEVKRLLADRSVKRSILKGVFRHSLDQLFGVRRSRVPRHRPSPAAAGGTSSTRPLSQATASELGEYLILLLESQTLQ